jgi:hypothetical protein
MPLPSSKLAGNRVAMQRAGRVSYRAKSLTLGCPPEPKWMPTQASFIHLCQAKPSQPRLSWAFTRVLSLFRIRILRLRGNGARIDVHDGTGFEVAAFLLGATMVPELIKCDKCGRSVNVLSWSPVYEDTLALAELDDSKTLLLTCKIDCPRCGPRIQVTRPLSNGRGHKTGARA